MSERSIGELVNPIVKRLESQMDRYLWWRKALAGDVGPIHETEPQAGFYRRKHKDGTMTGIAIWYVGDDPVAISNGMEANPSEAWVSGAKRPVTEEAYRAWESTDLWPDDHKIIVPTPPAAGSNEPQDEAEMLADQIESAKAGAADYTKVESDEQAAKAQSLRSRLLELKGTAEKAHKVEKAPSLAEGKRIDARWLPLAREAEAVANAIRAAMSAWETAKARRVAEAQRKAQEERLRQEEEARKAQEAGKPAPAPALDLEPVPTPPPTTQIKGGYGRAASVRVKKVVGGISDFDALLQHYHQAVQVFLLERAQKDVDAGFEVPGVTIEEERRVA